MAGKTDEKAATESTGGGATGLIVKGCFALGLASTIVLFLAAIDFQLFDLRHALGIPALAALGLFAICAGLGGGASTLSTASAARQARSGGEQLASRIEARMKAVEDKFSTHLDAEMAALKKQRDALQGELDKVHAAEEEKRLAEERRKQEEFEQLKQQNQALQEQLREISMTMRSTGRADSQDPAALTKAG